MGKISSFALCAAVLLASCGRQQAPLPPSAGADADGYSAPSATTIKANQAVAQALPLADQQDFEDARRGLIAQPPALKVVRGDGGMVWDMSAFSFEAGAAPDSVNPSLWRQAQLNDIHGLFKVADGIYQLRGFDISNMSLIEGKSGWIVVDPLTAAETSAAAMAFARQHLGDKPVSAMIFTHSHLDHFGGALGVVSAGQAAKLRVIAPAGFMEEATSENILVGPAMIRRAGYMYGKDLPRSARGHVDSGLGKNPAYGTVGILPPTDLVERSGQKMDIDGVEFVFQNASGTEAPAELTFYLPQKKAYCGAEMVSRNMHNLYTLRGAKVRDALRWSGLIEEALNLFGDAETYFGSHQWPLWGRERIHEFLRQQRDTYKYLHDQSVRMAVMGYTPGEIAEAMQMPSTLQKSFSSRGYYGTPRHNARAVYQHYLGWYDSNPAHLDPLPPEAAAKRYVDAMGGAAHVLELAQTAYDDGDYRWSAELLNHLVFADANQAEAKSLLAQSYDQLGYQAESAPWRDEYLSAAFELRHGAPEKGVNLASSLDLLRHTPVARFLDAMAARLNGPDADGLRMTVNLVFTDSNESYSLEIENAVLHPRAGAAPQANATLRLPTAVFLKMMIGQAGVKDTLLSDQFKVEGSRLDLIRFFSLFDKPQANFNIVTP